MLPVQTFRAFVYTNAIPNDAYIQRRNKMIKAYTIFTFANCSLSVRNRGKYAKTVFLARPEHVKIIATWNNINRYL